MAGASYVCQIGCMGNCEHGVPCGVFRFDEDHPHPTERGLSAHIGFDGELNHEWRGMRGRCRTSHPKDE